jgi:hypothetical protein
VLFPFAYIAPCAETLVAGIIACEMAVLDQSLLVVAAGDKGNLLVITHLNPSVVQLLLQLDVEDFFLSVHRQLYTGAAYRMMLFKLMSLQRVAAEVW